MSGLRCALLLAICMLLNACSAGLMSGRGVDPRDSSGANGAIANNNNMNVSGAVSLLSGPAVMNWFERTFMPDRREDAPPPASRGAGGERMLVEQDCTNPAHQSAATLPCR